jgi:hypothetical protein
VSAIPPLDVSVQGRRLSCVIDAELALSRYGLLFVTRLAEELDVWLVRALWQLLDNTQFFLANPGDLLPSNEEDEPSRSLRRRECEALVDTLRQWEAARLQTDLAGLRLFWAGDARCESMLPKDVDKGLVERFEVLAAELDDRTSSAPATHDLVQNCRRDTAALATALIRHRPIVFSICGRDGGSGTDAEPGLCAFLRESGIDCRRVRAHPHATAIKRHLFEIFARSGALELLWAGLQLAALHLIVPRAVVLPVEAEFDRRFADPLAAPLLGEAKPASWFSGASAYWWKVNLG